MEKRYFQFTALKSLVRVDVIFNVMGFETQDRGSAGRILQRGFFLLVLHIQTICH